MQFQIDDYKQLTEEQTGTLCHVLTLSEPPYDEFIESLDEIPLLQILHKRIVAFKLPRFEPSAYFVIGLLTDRPGTVIMALIDILNKYDEIKPEKINAEFICMHVYPHGFYTEEAAKKHYYEHRPKEKQTGKYDYLYM